ncbi:ATP-binding cassette domain-containing protein [Yoonia sp.]|uniref:ATP-binding cassette domain-containing protein n=1 Tax=Yoonia sp. TaxID=2212373 RepID=UPI0019FAB724|nr:ATP-binding cassette domain-containing protein [Yoonia sp.]MBE0412306.1 ATP-binding cassette domain-containing protein [Yoonia sp.]
MGKTSLFKAISGRHPYSGGCRSVSGQMLDHPTAFAAARAGIAYVPQDRKIFPLMSVQENLETVFACLPKSNRTIPDQIFRPFPVLLDMKARRGGELAL